MIQIRYIIIIISFLGLINSNTFDINNNSFEGKWKWNKNNDYSTFDLELKIINNEIKGEHCIVSMNGRRIDCTDQDKYSIKGTLNGNIANITYTSYYSNTSGKATLELLNDGTLKWKITKEARGQTFFPIKAILVKQ